MSKKDNKKINKFFKELKREILDLKLTKHHFYYTTLCLIILILSLFLFNNYNKCNIYELNGYKDDFAVENGYLVSAKGNYILQINHLSYSGDIQNVTEATMDLYVKVGNEEKVLNTFSTISDEYFDLNEYLERIEFNITETKNNESVMTKEVIKNIEDNLYLRITLKTYEGLTVEKNINIQTEKVFSSNKLF